MPNPTPPIPPHTPLYGAPQHMPPPQAPQNPFYRPPIPTQPASAQVPIAGPAQAQAPPPVDPAAKVRTTNSQQTSADTEVEYRIALSLGNDSTSTKTHARSGEPVATQRTGPIESGGKSPHKRHNDPSDRS